MQNNDQLAIFESYRDDILSKFKNSIESEDKGENEIEKIEEPSESEDNDNFETPDIDDSENEDGVDDEPLKKKNIITRSQEVAIKLDPKLRGIVRNMPEVIEDVDIFTTIKRAIQDLNDEISNDDEKITDSPLSIYNMLINSGVYNEEEVMEDDDRLNPENKGEDLDDDALTVDDYYDDDDFSGEKEFNLSKKTRGEREDMKSGMRRDVERSKAEDILRQMGVDFEGGRRFSDDD